MLHAMDVEGPGFHETSFAETWEQLAATIPREVAAAASDFPDCASPDHTGCPWSTCIHAATTKAHEIADRTVAQPFAIVLGPIRLTYPAPRPGR